MFLAICFFPVLNTCNFSHEHKNCNHEVDIQGRENKI